LLRFAYWYCDKRGIVDVTKFLRSVTYKQLMMWQAYYNLSPDELAGREPVPQWKRLKMLGQMHAAYANAEGKRDSKGNRIVKRK
jgi:hypothetical protein